jgi:hypothetical protein
MRPNDYGGVSVTLPRSTTMTPFRLPAAALVAAALLLCSACGAAKDDDKGAAAPSSSPSSAAAELIRYDQEEPSGVSIAKAAEVSKLEGAPNDFKQFIAGLIDGLKTPPDEDCQLTVGVAKIDTSGFAFGSQHSCGGAVYIWAKQDGVWQEIWGGQELPDCDAMEKYSVPTSIVGDKCLDAEKQGHVPYPR